MLTVGHDTGLDTGLEGDDTGLEGQGEGEREKTGKVQDVCTAGQYSSAQSLRVVNNFDSHTHLLFTSHRRSH